MRYQKGNGAWPPATGSLAFAADFLGELTQRPMVKVRLIDGPSDVLEYIAR
jgi:hypothetical protein